MGISLFKGRVSYEALLGATGPSPQRQGQRIRAAPTPTLQPWCVALPAFRPRLLSCLLCHAPAASLWDRLRTLRGRGWMLDVVKAPPVCRSQQPLRGAHQPTCNCTRSSPYLEQVLTHLSLAGILPSLVAGPHRSPAYAQLPVAGAISRQSIPDALLSPEWQARELRAGRNAASVAGQVLPCGLQLPEDSNKARTSAPWPQSVCLKGLQPPEAVET